MTELLYFKIDKRAESLILQSGVQRRSLQQVRSSKYAVIGP